MNMDLINCSYSLDLVIKEKLRPSTDLESSTIPELKTQINSLKYLIYVINQDRIVISIKNLRQALIRTPYINSSSSPIHERFERISTPKLDHLGLELYELTENSSEVVTVINTSILPTSHEMTEREFSPFSLSPMPNLQPPNSTFLTTEATHNICKKANQTSSDLLSEEFQLSSSSEFSFCNVHYTMTYIEKPPGDDEITVSGQVSRLQSPLAG